MLARLAAMLPSWAEILLSWEEMLSWLVVMLACMASRLATRSARMAERLLSKTDMLAWFRLTLLSIAWRRSSNIRGFTGISVTAGTADTEVTISAKSSLCALTENEGRGLWPVLWRRMSGQQQGRDLLSRLCINSSAPQNKTDSKHQHEQVGIKLFGKQCQKSFLVLWQI